MLRKRGHEVRCFAPAIRPDICFPELITQIDLRGVLPRVRIGIPYRDFASLAASSIFAPLFAGNFDNFDVILSHGQPATWIGYLVSRRSSRPRVTYLHQPARFLYPRPVDLRVGWRTKRDFALMNDIVVAIKPLAVALDHVSVASSDKVMVNSRWTGKQVEEIYGTKPILCPPGFDEDKFFPIQNKSDLTVNGQQVRKPFILSTNRHYPQKGLGDLIEIFANVRQHVNSQLVLTGHFTNYTPFLKNRCAELGIERDVLFTGHVREDELVRLYQNADVYAFTSPEEDFGLGPIEAMASGTPVVVWDSAGPGETVIDGEIGLKAKPNDLGNFAAKLIRFLQDARFSREISSNAARHVVNNFSWTEHVRILEKTLIETAS
jgi:glycosyltransferase involved in cell wall biosynthesis